jgi:hypothetical protein
LLIFKSKSPPSEYSKILPTRPISGTSNYFNYLDSIRPLERELKDLEKRCQLEKSESNQINSLRSSQSLDQLSTTSYFVEGNCPLDYHGDPNCIGWYISKYRCECGNFKGWIWEDEDLDYNNLLKFNIHDTRILHHMVEKAVSGKTKNNFNILN